MLADPGADGRREPAIDSTMGWAEDPELTEPTEGYDRPTASILGDLRRDDSFALTFEDSGEVVERDHGDQVRFNATLEAIDGRAYDWDDEAVAEGMELAFETSSNRLLNRLKEHDPVEGKTIEVEVLGTGMDAEYRVSEV